MESSPDSELTELDNLCSATYPFFLMLYNLPSNLCVFCVCVVSGLIDNSVTVSCFNPLMPNVLYLSQCDAQNELSGIDDSI